MSEPTFGFIGAGRVATVLAMNLIESGYPVVAVSSKTNTSAENMAFRLRGCQSVESGQKVAGLAQVVFVTTPDSEIDPVVNAINWSSDHYVVHCSGSLTHQVLAAAKKSRAQVGSFHPLHTFNTVSGEPSNLKGVYFGIDATGGLLSLLEAIATRLGGFAFTVPVESRPLYHLAAVMSCSNLTALMAASIELWEKAGLSAELGHRALGHLAIKTLMNFVDEGPKSALTGPMVRGDFETLRQHHDVLRRQTPHLFPLHLALEDQAARILSAPDDDWRQESCLIHGP